MILYSQSYLIFSFLYIFFSLDWLIDWLMMMMDNLLSKSLTYTLALIAVICTAKFLIRLFWVRSKMIELKKRGLVRPQLVLEGGTCCMYANIQTSQCPPYNYYIDTWPFLNPPLIIASPSTLYQIMQEHPLPKHHTLRSFLRPLTDGLDIV